MPLSPSCPRTCLLLDILTWVAVWSWVALIAESVIGCARPRLTPWADMSTLPPLTVLGAAVTLGALFLNDHLQT